MEGEGRSGRQMSMRADKARDERGREEGGGKGRNIKHEVGMSAVM